MAPQKLVVIVGATGGQGGSVIDVLKSSGDYKIRGLTRNKSSSGAKALSSSGVEVVEADLNNKDSLVKAFEGASVIFATTDFFEPFMASGPEAAEKVEFQQAKNLADAAAATSTLTHYIWSTLPSGEGASGGKYHVPHFEAKANADEYILSELPQLAKKTTFLWIAYYLANLTFPLFTPNLLESSGKYVWIQPCEASTPITIIGDHRANVGIFARAILAKSDLTRGRYVLAEVETTTQGGILEAYGKVTGRTVQYIKTTLDVYNQLFPKWGEEMGVMLQFWEEARDQSWSKKGVVPLRKEDLGIDPSSLMGLETTLRKDWVK